MIYLYATDSHHRWFCAFKAMLSNAGIKYMCYTSFSVFSFCVILDCGEGEQTSRRFKWSQGNSTILFSVQAEKIGIIEEEIDCNPSRRLISRTGETKKQICTLKCRSLDDLRTFFLLCLAYLLEMIWRKKDTVHCSELLNHKMGKYIT